MFGPRLLLCDGQPSLKKWLGKATNWLDQQGGRMPLETDAIQLHRHNWLEAQILRREVEESPSPSLAR